ncbi:folylpolyglutamate synthase/dihydrofolate synthase family protein [Sphingomonas lutea]
MDFATSTDPTVQAQLDRLPKASSAGDILTLDRIRELCARLGNPQDRLPPVFHVAGTNGKGSTIAWLRASIEAAGGTVHAYTSPHLVRFNERIRIAGRLIEDRELAPLLEHVIDAGEGLDASFFEVATAAAFVTFSRTPADAALIEVGLGGRLDATNVVSPVITGISTIGIDHAHILGDTLEQIAFEKAGIAKPGVPLVTRIWKGSGPGAVIAAHAADVGAPLEYRFNVELDRGVNRYIDRFGEIEVPPGALTHQLGNWGLATAMLRHQSTVTAYDPVKAPELFDWPARLQRLTGPLVEGLPCPVTLDGAHNAQGAEALAMRWMDWFRGERGYVLMAGILANREPEALLGPFAGIVERFIALPIPGHDHHDPEALAAIADRLLGRSDSIAAPSIEEAFAALRAMQPTTGTIVMGSLYLAGEILRLSGQIPD